MRLYLINYAIFFSNVSMKDESVSERAGNYVALMTTPLELAMQKDYVINGVVVRDNLVVSQIKLLVDSNN